MMATGDTFTSIPIHRSTLRALRGVKLTDQTWDDLLLALVDDYLPPEIRRELVRRLSSETIVPGGAMKREYARWRRDRAIARRR